MELALSFRFEAEDLQLWEFVSLALELEKLQLWELVSLGLKRSSRSWARHSGLGAYSGKLLELYTL